ncbi:MAG: cytidylate kinase-like family protein [Bacteroidota bacterium]
MENILYKYMVERFKEDKIDKKHTPNLPFITISREYGCPAKEIAALLVENLNKQIAKDNVIPPWRWISKEILEVASEELNVNPSRIKLLFGNEKRGIIEEILTSLSQRYYHSDQKIRKTLAQVITDFAFDGNVVIVGRGGIAATLEVVNGLHIRLIAPIEWRANKIKERGYCDSIEQAKQIAYDTDKKRAEFINSMNKKTIDNTSFDLTYNCQFLNKDEIVSSIIYHLKMKGMI